MTRRIEQLNDQLRNELANLIIREIPSTDILMTISYAVCSKDLKYAKIGVSIFPETQAGQMIEKLKKHSSRFSRILRKKLKIRQIPKFNWVVDKTESQAAELDAIFKQIDNGK